MTEHQRRAEAFLVTGSEYQRLRPPYPDTAVDWMLPAGAQRVAELGAGSGRLTDALVDRGLEVVAVDPSATMLGVLGQRHPHVTRVVARAEETGLPDAGFDAVVVAQAWHWIEPEAGFREVARILRPGGAATLSMVWNQRIPTGSWQEAAADVLPAVHGVELAERPDPHSADLFAPRETRVFEWQRHVSTADFLKVYTTNSPYLIASAADQERASSAWEQLNAQAEEPTTIEHFRTRVWRYRFRG